MGDGSWNNNPIDHYSGNASSLALEPERYGPLLEVDEQTEEGLELLDSLAPMLIGGMVRGLNARKTFRGPSAAERLESSEPGTTRSPLHQDATCGCGSGRPYDHCCGAH